MPEGSSFSKSKECKIRNTDKIFDPSKSDDTVLPTNSALENKKGNQHYIDLKREEHTIKVEKEFKMRTSSPVFKWPEHANVLESIKTERLMITNEETTKLARMLGISRNVSRVREYPDRIQDATKTVPPHFVISRRRSSKQGKNNNNVTRKETQNTNTNLKIEERLCMTSSNDGGEGFKNSRDAREMKKKNLERKISIFI